MKSKRAKAKIESEGWNPYSSYGEISDEVVYSQENVLHIVLLAEQEAEERHAKELEALKEHSLHFIVKVLKFIGTVCDERIEKLKEKCRIELNGEQDDE